MNPAERNFRYDDVAYNVYRVGSFVFAEDSDGKFFLGVREAKESLDDVVLERMFKDVSS